MSKYSIHYGLLPSGNHISELQYGYYVTEDGKSEGAFDSENNAFKYIMKLENNNEYLENIEYPYSHIEDMYSQLCESRMKYVDRYYTEYLTKQYIQQMKDNYFNK